MKKKIIFQKGNKKNIYFLIHFILGFVEQIIEYFIFPNENELNEINEQKSNFYLPTKILISLYIAKLSDFLAIIPYFIRKKLLKKNQEDIPDIKIEDNKNSDDPKLIYNDNNKSVINKKKKTIIINCIFVGILDFLQIFSLILYNIIIPDKQFYVYVFSCIVPFEIIIQFICSYLILKIHFYKLQYFSLFLNLGLFIIILIIDIIISSNSNNLDGKVYFFLLFNIIFYSIQFSLGKKIILDEYISIYFLIIIQGCVALILSLFFSLIMFFFKKDIFPRIGFFFTKMKFIGLMIAKIFSSFFISIFTWLIIDNFSPNYLPLSLLFYEFSTFIVNIIADSNYLNQIKNCWDVYVRLFLYLISFIGVMIHNEIVVINICNLGSDTKYFLDREVESEEIFANTKDPEILKRYDSVIDVESESTESNENKGVLN